MKLIVLALMMFQMWPFPGPGQKPAASAPAGVTDDFAGTGAMSSSWTQALTTGGGYSNVNTCARASGTVQTSATYKVCAYLNNTAGLGAYSTVQADVYITSSDDFGAVILRANNTGYGNFYQLDCYSTSCILKKVVNGATPVYITEIATGTITAGWYTVKVVPAGASFPYKFEVWFGPQGAAVDKGSVTDSGNTFADGVPGVLVREMGTGTKTSAQVDNFSAQ